MKKSLCRFAAQSIRSAVQQRSWTRSLTTAAPMVSSQFGTTHRLSSLPSARHLHLSVLQRCVHNNQKNEKQEASQPTPTPPPDDLANLPDFVRDHVFLSDLPFHFLPNMWKSFRNRIFEFMIRAYFDRDFSIASFSEGAIQAVVKISNALADGDIKSVESMDVLSHDLVAEVKENLAKMSEEQREFLRVSPEDIMRNFIYEIGIIMDDNTDEKFVEILFVVYGQHGIGAIRNQVQSSVSEGAEKLKQATTVFTNAVQPLFGAKEFVCNYRFIRQFRSPSVDSTNASYWIINKLNHFRPLHYVLRHRFEQPLK